jgi:hypothetical protein
VHRVLDVLAVKLDGTPASADYLGRRRVFYNVLGYAVREKRLPDNPLDSTTWEAPDASVAEVNPRVVASPEQVRELLIAVSYIGPRRGGRLVAFFACMYFAMLRPSETAAMCADDCMLPPTGWGRLELHQTSPAPGRQWTDTGDGHEHRGLKNRPAGPSESSPSRPNSSCFCATTSRVTGWLPMGACSAAKPGECSIPRPISGSGIRPACSGSRPLAARQCSPAAPTICGTAVSP